MNAQRSATAAVLATASGAQAKSVAISSRRLQVVLRRVTDAVVRVHGLAGLDADEHVVSEVIGRQEVVAVVGRDDAQPQLLGQADGTLVDLPLLLDAVVLQLEPVAIRSRTGP